MLLGTCRKKTVRTDRFIFCYKRLLFALILALFCFQTPAADEVVTVVLKSDETLRSLAVKYFGEPNDWEVILFYNGYKSAGEVNIGASLKIPIGLYKKLVAKLAEVQQVITQANSEGAGILARELIEAATLAQKEAIELKKRGKLDSAFEKVLTAASSANEAIRQTKVKRIQAISAILSEKKGKVQSRKKDQTIWYDANKDQELIEKEHIRTMSGAAGEISFIDGSKLNLSENSLAVIEAMKQDLVKNTNTSSVVVLQGDIMAYLSSQSKKNQVNVSAPGVETDIRSRSFRASRDANNVTKFANYDGEIDVKAAGAQVTIHKNEGTSIAPGQKPKGVRKLPDPPKITTPTLRQKFFTEQVLLKWEAVPEAQAYHLQIANARSFSDRIVDRNVRGKSEFQWHAAGTGVFYVRAASIDRENFTGAFSNVVEFYVDRDVTPPFLLVDKPDNNVSVFQPLITVSGDAEYGAALFVGKDSVVIAENGQFSHQYRLTPGENRLLIRAVDQAGNKSRTERIVHYNADDNLIHLNSEKTIVTNRAEYAIMGSTKPGSAIRIDGQAVNLAGNHFNHIVYLKEGVNSATILATSAKGDTQSVTLTLTLDQSVPEIELGDIPSFTREASIEIEGTVSEESRVLLNKEEFPVTNFQFNAGLSLAEGENLVELVAEDVAGNQTMIEIEIFRDTEKPKIIRTVLAPENVKGGELIQISVAARDEGVGLARNGKYNLGIGGGGQSFSGILSLSSGNNYTGTLMIPPGVQGKLIINELVIQDYLGNQADYP